MANHFINLFAPRGLVGKAKRIGKRMKTQRQIKFLHILMLLSLGLGMIFPSVPAMAQSEPVMGYVDNAGGYENYIDVTLHADHAPSSGELATLTLTATPAFSAPNLRIDWIVGDGVELLGGAATESIGAVGAGQTVAQVRQIRLPGPGVYKVMAQAGYALDPSVSFSAAGVLFFTVNADGSTTASPIDPNAKNFDRNPITNVYPAVTTSAVRAPNDDPCFYVGGRLTRWDRTPNTNPGYDAPVEVPLRYVKIALREEDTLFDDTYGEGTTDANGQYTFSFCDDDGVFDDELEIYLRVYAEIDYNGSDVVSVEDDGIIDDLWEFDSGIVESEGGGFVIDMHLQDNEQSAIMNIADTIFDAWMFWNNSGGAKGDDAIFDGEAEVHYEPGDGVENSYYNGYFLVGNVFNNDDISIADDASDPDPWDDSVIIHEWGHMADDYYGCDDNGGGDHFINQLADDLELAWGEGYPNYYQSAVRSAFSRPNASWYLDVNGTGMGGIAIDLETYDQGRAAFLLSEFNELAIAAMLYDLMDNANDPRTPATAGPPAMPAAGPFDSVSHGHNMIQEVYTDPFFESNGDWVDDTCTSFVYLWSWLKLGKPANAATAEAVTKNNGRSNPFFGASSFASIADAMNVNSVPQGGSSIYSTNLNDNPNQIDHRWWQRLTLVADNSASMAEANKFGAVKTVMKETVNDALNAAPKGVEVRVQTFNNGSPFNQPVLEGQFRGEGIYPWIDAMTTVTTDDFGCLASNDTIGALRQGAEGQTRGQVWLYTDSDAAWLYDLGLARSRLNAQQMRASIALLGGCSSFARRQSDVGGDEESYLQLAADGSQSSGIVPYMLLALGTGGQFLYVNADQLQNASDILRAQLANSAGAGKWSDYVSDTFTYRWDRLEPNEYLWVTGLGGGIPLGNTAVEVALPGEFPFWDSATSTVEVFEDGYFWMNPCHGELCSNFFFRYANILSKDLNWYFDSNPNLAAADTPDAPDAGPEVWVYYGNYQEWFVITVDGYRDNAGNRGTRRAYQMWLNMQTGEVRYLYDAIEADDVSNAEISVREDRLFGEDAVVLVSNQDLAGAANGSGYKFVPAPPVEKREYAVKADSLIQRIGFLQTGYSGAFAPMIVTDPNGADVVCGQGGVTCTTVDHIAGDRMVQYVEVPNSGPGTWKATIDATSTQATFSFNALAASDLAVDSPTNRLNPSIGATPLVVQMGRTVDGNSLTGWLQSPNGQRFSADFTLYDDGAHGDGRAGDGRFGLPDFAVNRQGVGYLWVKGQINGEDFERADPVPFNFQPVRVTATPQEIINYNEPVNVSFQVDNLTDRQLCFRTAVTIPAGWSAAWNVGGLCQNIAANGSATFVLTVTPSWPDAPSGTLGEVSATFLEVAEGGYQGSDSVTFERRRPPAVVMFDGRAANYEIRPSNTLSVPVLIRATDDQGYPVVDGTMVEVVSSQGVIEPISPVAQTAAVNDQATLEFTNGSALFNFIPGTTEGDVTLTATMGDKSDTLTLHVMTPNANSIELTATPTDLFNGPTTSALVATIKDSYGVPVSNATVRLVVSGDDGTQGTINGSEAISATTNVDGQLNATFTKAEGGIGTVWIRAELLGSEGGSLEVKQEDQVRLSLDASASFTEGVLIPFVSKR